MNFGQRIQDRRIVKERRYHEATILAPDRRSDPERRSGIERRTQWPTVCLCCGKICESDREWKQGAVTIETEIECREGICMSCSKKKFPQFYSGK